jgi:hypothetical protein
MQADRVSMIEGRAPWLRRHAEGDGDIVTGLKNKIQSAVADVTPSEMLAKQHRKAEPGSAKH